MKLIGLTAAGCAALLLPAVASADVTAFRTPSKNIGCIYATGPTTLRCDVINHSNKGPKFPSSCKLDYGFAFEMTPNGKPKRICHGDTAADPTAGAIPYNASRKYGPFSCKSRSTGLTCVNAKGHGWTLAKGSQKLF